MVESRNSVSGTLRRLMFSRYYFGMYIIMLLLSIFSLVFAFSDKVDTSSVWFVCLEVAINVVMSVEVILRIVAWRKVCASLSVCACKAPISRCRSIFSKF
jgi:hypothetical protein